MNSLLIHKVVQLVPLLHVGKIRFLFRQQRIGTDALQKWKKINTEVTKTAEVKKYKKTFAWWKETLEGLYFEFMKYHQSTFHARGLLRYFEVYELGIGKESELIFLVEMQDLDEKRQQWNEVLDENNEFFIKMRNKYPSNPNLSTKNGIIHTVFKLWERLLTEKAHDLDCYDSINLYRKYLTDDQLTLFIEMAESLNDGFVIQIPYCVSDEDPLETDVSTADSSKDHGNS